MRKESRKPLSMNALCRTLHHRATIEIVDISSGGCRLVLAEFDLGIGQRVVLRPDAMDSLTGTVRWREGDSAGVEFDTVLYPPLVDHLCRTYPSSNRKIDLEIAA